MPSPLRRKPTRSPALENGEQDRSSPATSSNSESTTHTHMGALTRRSVSSSDEVVIYDVEEAQTGMRWKYSKEGMALISRAVQQAASASPEAELTRRLFIDGVAYFLQGLPGDLTPEERSRLSACLPPQLEPVQQPITPATVGWNPPGEAIPGDLPATRPSLIRKIVAKITMCIVSTVLIFIHYATLFFSQFRRYDQSYQITERLLVGVVLALDAAWKSAIKLMNRMCAIENGTAGRALGDLLNCLAREVSGGLYDGVEEATGFRIDRSGPNTDDVGSRRRPS